MITTKEYEYTPDNWVIVKIPTESKPLYKVLAGWSGGYLHGSSWRMNSGIIKVDFDGIYYKFFGNSGSVYKVHKESYGLKMNNAHIWEQMKDIATLMDENTNWLEIEWV